MAMAYIRNYYGVPAKRGGRIRYTGENPPKLATIVASRGQYLKVRFDGASMAVQLHPTWAVEYVAEGVA